MSDDPNSTGNPSEQPEQSAIIIYPDADEHNANWLRILEQRRQERDGHDADEPPLPPTPQQQHDQKETHDHG